MKKDKILLSSERIQEIISSLAAQLNRDYCLVPSPYPVIFIGVLNGSFMFLSDLMKEVNIKCEVEFIKVKSYYKNKKDKIFISPFNQIDLKDKRVIIVEDIVDSGDTVRAVEDWVAKHHPVSQEVCTLLLREGGDTHYEYVGEFVKKGLYVYGYGMDDDQKQRNLNNIYIKSNN